MAFEPLLILLVGNNTLQDIWSELVNQKVLQHHNDTLLSMLSNFENLQKHRFLLDKED